MKMIWLSQPIVLLFIFSFCFPNTVYSLLPCAQHDQSSLLRLKHSLLFDSDYWSPDDKYLVESWNSTSDCCVWGGVTCSPRGDVVGLDLSHQSISGGIDPLFDLRHLQSLDLYRNHFYGILIPSSIGKLVNLLHLNLSSSGFGGQVPIEISTLTSLLTLKISSPDYQLYSSLIPLKLENPTFSTLIKNLTNLVELDLDGVNMSAEGEGHRWGHALSSSLPNLRALSLSGCSLSGPLHDSLGKLQALTSIDLSYNNLSAPLPDFLANFSNLTSLSLSYCGLYGDFPPFLTRMLSLQYLNLGGNKLLTGTLPEGIGNMTSLTDFILWECGFSGFITHIHWENLASLAYLLMSGNELSGSVPMSLFSLSSMIQLDLSSNQFSGQLGQVDTAQFKFLYLSGNKFEGPIPTFILNLDTLVELRLSRNNFSGTIDLTPLFQNLLNILSIDLSFNSLSIVQSVSSNSFTTVPQLASVVLASCDLKEFPSFLRNQSTLGRLDLSENKIHGLIPNWIWIPTIYNLNLSHNSLIGFETSLPNLTSLSSLYYLDLKSNLLQGEIPLPPSAQYLDYSNNNFSSIILGTHTPNIEFLSLSSNNLDGGIPLSFCNIDKVFQVVVDLSNNSLSGTIPPCLLTMNLAVLNLKKNNLSGSIPDAFQGNCSLETLDLSENQLHGTVPESMVKCKALKVLNLGNNELNGGFPCWLTHVSNLSVLVLRSNRFHGPVRCAPSNETTNSWSKLQIIDIAANSFDGELPSESFKYWTTMTTQTDVDQQKLEYLRYGRYYQDSVTIINKGIFMELVKILTVYDAIDFSCNHFEGSIPQSIGDLISLYALNLSHNHLTGSIPPSIGNLKAMESLDLANNSLNGVIPEQLASLTFISFLNLSFNHLVGRIPTSTQLQSFSERSYMGNKGLYGPPLKINCGNGCEPPPLIDPNSADVGKEVDWKLISAEIGYAVGLASVIGSLMFWKRWNVWLFESVDRAIFKVFPSFDPHKRNSGTRGNKTSHQMQRQQ